MGATIEPRRSARGTKMPERFRPSSADIPAELQAMIRESAQVAASKSKIPFDAVCRCRHERRPDTQHTIASVRWALSAVHSVPTGCCCRARGGPGADARVALRSGTDACDEGGPIGDS